jgi:hypothetical protein
MCNMRQGSDPLPLASASQRKRSSSVADRVVLCPSPRGGSPAERVDAGAGARGGAYAVVVNHLQPLSSIRRAVVVEAGVAVESLMQVRFADGDGRVARVASIADDGFMGDPCARYYPVLEPTQVC